MTDKAEFLFIGTNQLDQTKILFASSKGTDRGSILYNNSYNDTDEYMTFSVTNSEKVRIGENGNISINSNTIMPDNFWGLKPPHP